MSHVSSIFLRAEMLHLLPIVLPHVYLLWGV